MTLWQQFSENASLRNLAAREDIFFRAACRELYGQTAVQLGFPARQTLQNARVRRIAAAGEDGCPIRCRWDALPFAPESLDAVSLPHTLDVAANYHAVLHEVVRSIRPGGHLLVAGFNPWSLWRLNPAWRRLLPEKHLPPSLPYLKKILEEQNFALLQGQFFVYTPLSADADLLRRTDFLNAAGNRWWPHWSAAYGILLVKQRHSLRPLPAQTVKEPALAALPAASAKIPRTAAHAGVI